MATEVPEISISDVSAVLLTGFVGLFYGFSLGIDITQKFSKYKKSYQILKRIFPICFGLLAVFHIVNFATVEDRQFEWVLPTSFEEFLAIYGPFSILQFPLMLFVGIITFFVGYKHEEGKQRSRILWLFLIAYIIFLLTPAEPTGILIGMFTAFQIASIFGLHIGIKQTDKIHLFDLIIRWVKKKI